MNRKRARNWVRRLGCVFWLLLSVNGRSADATAVFNEVMYHPATGPEWLELKNVLRVNLDLSGWRIDGGVGFVFPEGTVLPAGGFLVVSSVAGNPAGARGPWSGSLANEGETICLHDRNGRIMDELQYNDSDDWPIGPDGSGSTLAKLQADSASALPASWLPSAQTGGSPGAENFPAPPSAPKVVLNELAPAGARFFVELRNLSAAPAELGGLIIQSPDGGGSCVLLPGSLAAGDLLLFDAVALGFNPPPEAKIFLFAPNRTALLDAQRTRTTGRARSGDGLAWLVPTGPTPGATNTFALHDQIVISEILYHPRLQPARAGIFADRTLVDLSDTWRYEASGADLGSAWQQSAYNDGAWATGVTPLEASAGQDYAATVQADAPVAYWRLGENPAIGAASDASPVGGAQNGTYTNAAARAGLINGDPNGAVSFAGATHVAGKGLSGAFANDWTIEAWFTHDAVSQWGGIFSNNGVSGDSRAPVMTFIDLSTRLGINGIGATADNISVDLGPAHLGKTVYAVITKTGSNTAGSNSIKVRAWVEGVEVPSAIGSTTWDLAPRDGWLIGRSWAGTSGYFRGVIDEVAVYDRALADSEISEHARSGRLASESGLPVGEATKYFRKSFTFSSDPAKTALRLETLVDDGAVFYLNGNEIARQNMPEGAVIHGTLAASVVPSATLSAPVPVPAASLIQGVNVLAVELHQAVAGDPDAVFGLRLTARETTLPPLTLSEPDAEFIELYNRSATNIDLGGWSLAGDVSYTFPPGTTLAAKGFLAVAHNPDVLQSLHPGAPIIGPFNGRLPDSGGRLVLKDDRNNPADEVRYYEGGNWPERADGGGSSLELRDPDADNSKAEAWAASDESGKSVWRTYTSRRIAQPYLGSFRSPIGGAVPPAEWNEFVFGLLDAGEVLIDDISLIETPDGTPLQLIQNGTFQSDAIGSAPAKWRSGGTQIATVVADPTNPANRVMRLVSTGATGYIGNDVETTLVGNRKIVTGREYQASFRAKWMGGSGQLNNRAYFTLIPETTVLDMPQSNGTPGSQNSRFALNIGPTFSEFRHQPAVPAVSQAVTVSAVPADPDGVSAVRLRWSANGGAWNSLPMTAGPNGVYAASIPGRAAATIVQFYAEATDAFGTVSTFPAAGPASRALYEINDGAAAPATKLGIDSFRIIMTKADSDKLHANTNLMSAADLGATLIVNEREIFYDVGVQLKGSQHSRDAADRVGFSLTLHPDHLLKGVHRRIALDRSSRAPGTPKPSPDEIVIKQFLNHAGGLASEYDDIAYVVAPRNTHNSVATLQTTRLGSEYLKSQFVNGDDGSIYEYEMLFTAAGTTGGIEGQKIHTGGPFLDYDVEDLGPDKEVYRFHMQKENNLVQDDFSAIIALGRAMELSGPALDAAASQVLDADQWMRAVAARSLIMDFDGYGTTVYRHNHNLKFYVRPVDQKVLAFLWDIDGAFSLSTSGALWPPSQPSTLTKLIERPDNLHRYYGHLHDMISTTWNSTYMGPWMTHYGAKAGQNMAVNLPLVQQRANYVLSRLPARVPFALTTNGGADFTVNTPTVILAGTGWINVREIRLQGRPEAVPATWLSPTTWQATVPVQPGTHLLTLQAYDFQGQLIATDTITITSTGAAPLPIEFLRITELHYHPAAPTGAELNASTDPDDFEFIELQNIGPQTLDIGGCFFDAGITFAFAAGTTLAAGESIVVVRYVAAFRARYGSAARVAGSYTPASLSNGGELLTLRDATGAIIQTFAWDDAWFPATDGAGYALMMRNPSAPLIAWSTAAFWAIGATPGGTPGTANGNAIAWQFEGWRHTYFTAAELSNPLITGPLASAAGDGLANQLRYALGFNPTEPASASLTASINTGQFTATYRRRKNLLDVQFAVEASSDFATWSSLVNPIITATDRGDGTESVTVRDPAFITTQARRFLRLRVTIR